MPTNFADRTHIRTHTGRKVYPLDLSPADIAIEDIAHALSNVCRFTGHTRWHYSVAQHSVYVSKRVPDEFALVGLLHDASEAYIADIASPLKHTGVFEQYRQVEDRIMRAVAERFLLPWPEPAVVKGVDRRMLATEVAQLMRVENPGLWGEEYGGFRIEEWSPREAYWHFMCRYEVLTGRIS